MKNLAYLSVFLLSVFSTNVFGQDLLKDQLKNLEGIWIAEDYKNSFDKTLSSIHSKWVFDPGFPVGLRINKQEISDSSLSIGFGVLHDHLIHPEISRFTVINNDSIFEQGHFRINFIKSDSLNFHQTSEIYYFSYESRAFLTWTFSPDTALILYRPANQNEPESIIRFKRISNTFDVDYPFPNPIYYYSRIKTLTGTYVLRDSLNNVVSDYFQIKLNGTTEGYLPFQNKIFYFSTDVYCGPTLVEDLVLVCLFDDNLEPECNTFIYKRINEKTIEFRKSIWIENDEGEIEQQPSKLIYSLTKIGD